MVDTDSQLITAVAVLPGNAPDNLGALELVEASEANTGVTVEETMGDAAYGDGDTRQAFADAGRTLIARVPGRPNRSHFPKEDFRIDLEAGTCTCPAGNITRTLLPAGRGRDSAGRVYQRVAFRFDAAVCGVCPLRPQCLAAKPGTGRTVRLHPQEALLQQARALQQSEAFAEYRQRRVVVEHRLARLVQLGIRQSRYFGRIKTRFQLLLAATVANLTLVAAKAGMTGDTDHGPNALVTGIVDSAANASAAWLGLILTLTLLASALLSKSFFPNPSSQKGLSGPVSRLTALGVIYLAAVFRFGNFLPFAGLQITIAAPLPSPLLRSAAAGRPSFAASGGTRPGPAGTRKTLQCRRETVPGAAR